MSGIDFDYLVVCLKTAGLGVNNVEPDQMLHSAAFCLGVQCCLGLMSEYKK